MTERIACITYLHQKRNGILGVKDCDVLESFNRKRKDSGDTIKERFQGMNQRLMEKLDRDQ